MPTIAVDAMGGDQAPREIVRGVARASLETDIDCVLVGDERRIGEELSAVAHDRRQIDVIHSPQFVAMDEAPREGLDAKPNASVAVAARAVADGRADALVSAGNTGALILASARTFPLLPAVRRAALASVFPRKTQYPGQDRLALILDVGATVTAGAEELVQFAVMGSTYAKRISKVSAPRVGLLNMGAERFKGGEVLAQAYERLDRIDELNFVGNVEGNDLAKGRADVIVCEGLLGNVVLKLVEGVAEVALDVASYARGRKLLWRLALSMLGPGLRRLKSLTDYAKYGGAPLLGFDRLVLKAHGRSSARAVENAVKVAANAVRDRVPQEIAAGLAGAP